MKFNVYEAMSNEAPRSSSARLFCAIGFCVFFFGLALSILSLVIEGQAGPISSVELMRFGVMFMIPGMAAALAGMITQCLYLSVASSDRNGRLKGFQMHWKTQEKIWLAVTGIACCGLFIAGYFLALPVVAGYASANTSPETIQWASVLCAPAFAGLITLPFILLAAVSGGLPPGRQRP
ncbi:MAG: hypothetical protein KAG87_15925 [Marinobacter adhaerens]|nr:hypothetical protein [Marinobacter adhaerens]